MPQLRLKSGTTLPRFKIKNVRMSAKKKIETFSLFSVGSVRLAQIGLVTPLILVFALCACQPAPNPAVPPPAKISSKLTSTAPAPYPAHFQKWLTANPDQALQFKALTAYLSREGVADVLPIWQVIQTETPERAAQCEIAAYEVPPEDMWPTMVPTLRLVRQEIIPLLGPVKVLSSFRSQAANRCSSGAPGSPHKSYSALDLAVIKDMPQKEIFAKLCKRWDQLPASVGFGLGAYYTRHQPELNKEGRFHIDTMGRRTWGFGYGAYTSHCRELGYISVKSPKQIKLEEEMKLKAAADALVKEEAEAKEKIVTDAKTKNDTVALAKAKAKQAVQLKIIEAAKVEIKAQPIEIIVPAPLQTSDNIVISKTPSSKN